jgi:all-trans-retinol 13,14-reductase
MEISNRDIDYLVVGSGIAGLVFAALMSKSGKHVVVLEAHEFAGGYGHTFQLGKSAKFNAQLHYVWNCGKGETVHNILTKLGLATKVTFEKMNPDGFDHMVIPGYSMKIPSGSKELVNRLCSLFPEDRDSIQKFVTTVNAVAAGLDVLASKPTFAKIARDGVSAIRALSYLNATLQDVFDKHRLPLEVQSLLASQWPDFLLPPKALSFCAWVMLFTGYQRGAYYPTRHFEFVIDSLVESIQENGSKVLTQHEVTEFLNRGRVVQGVRVKDLQTDRIFEIRGSNVVCNMDPQKAARMIGIDKFKKSIRRRLSYDYSPSNFMIYCAVEGLDLAEFGFGKWNTFHSGHSDINESFKAMYQDHDYSNPSFAITTPGFMTDDTSDRPRGQQIIELLTVADYQYFRALRKRDKAAYRAKKKEIMNSIFDVMEAHYIPSFREHIVFKVGGTPTTNEKFCLSPSGNSYGSNMTPGNIGIGRLKAQSSLRGLYFCNSSSGFAGFSGTFWTGATLYATLTGDREFMRL